MCRDAFATSRTIRLGQWPVGGRRVALLPPGNSERPSFSLTFLVLVFRPLVRYLSTGPRSPGGERGSRSGAGRSKATFARASTHASLALSLSLSVFLTLVDLHMASGHLSPMKRSRLSETEESMWRRIGEVRGVRFMFSPISIQREKLLLSLVLLWGLHSIHINMQWNEHVLSAFKFRSRLGLSSNRHMAWVSCSCFPMPNQCVHNAEAIHIENISMASVEMTTNLAFKSLPGLSSIPK